MIKAFECALTLIAKKITEKYQTNPWQAIFIFDQLFLRPTFINSESERPFNIVEEDCGEDIARLTRTCHQIYLESDDDAKTKMLAIAKTSFVLAFKEFNLDFLSYHNPHVIASSDQFNSVVDRDNVSSAKEMTGEIAAIIDLSSPGINSVKVYNEHSPFTLFNQSAYQPLEQQIENDFKQQEKSYYQENNRRQRQSENYLMMREAARQMKHAILEKYLGTKTSIAIIEGEKIEYSTDAESNLKLFYFAKKISGENPAGQIVSFQNIQEEGSFPAALRPENYYKM